MYTVSLHCSQLSLRKTFRELGRVVILIIFFYCFISCEKSQPEIQPKFQNIASFSDGLALVEIVDTDNKHSNRYGFVDKDGNTVIPPRFIDYFSSFDPFWHTVFTFSAQSSDYTFSEGLALVKIGAKKGFIDNSGNMVIQPQFNDADPLSEGLALVLGKV